MGKKRSEKIFCLDNEIILIDTKGKVIPFSISEIALKEEIDRLLEEKNEERPINIFRRALKNITGKEVFHFNEKFKTEKKVYKIQDSSFYQKYAQYIFQKKYVPMIKKRETRKREGEQKRKAEIEYVRYYCRRFEK